MLRLCRKCNLEKEKTQFSKGRNADGLHSYCKNCMSKYSKKWWSKNGEDYHYLYAYGITKEEAKLLSQKQNNKCALCLKDLEFKIGFTNSAHVDHCHATGKVRGILCGNCNTALGKLGDSVESIKKVLKYLEGI